MSRRKLTSAIFAATVVVAALVLWTTRHPQQQTAPSTEANLDAQSVPGSHAVQTSRAEHSEESRDWFPDLSDTGDSSTPGSDGVRDSFHCDMDRIRARFSLLNSRGDTAEGIQTLKEVLSVLNASGDAELLLAASHLDYLVEHLGDDAAEGAIREPNLARALAADPLHPAALWNAANLCGSEPELGICQSSWLQTNIETVLGGNGEYWAREAVYRYRVGDSQGAFAAIQRASAAPEFENFVAGHARLIERALSTAQDIDYQERAVTAIAMSLGLMDAGNLGLLTVCGTESENDPEWRAACLNLASRFLADGRTFHSREVGARLQVRLYTMSGEDELANAAQETRAWLDNADLDDADDDVLSVLLTDERVIRGFLDEFEAGDEISATAWTKDEVARLKQDPAYSPCPPADAAGSGA